MSKITSIATQLRDVHLQSLFTTLYYGMAPLMDYWIQHCFPEDVLHAVARVDTALLDVLQMCLPGLRRGDELTIARVRLPVRRFGLGLRCRADLSPTAFLVTFCKAVPAMLDRVGRNGVAITGFLPQLAPMLGAGSFDHGAEERRFAHMLRHNCRLGAALQTHWAVLQREIGVEPDGVLRTPAAGAGAGVDKLQRTLTRQREARRFQTLDVVMRQLPQADMRRHTWLNLDSFSTVWVTCWPQTELYMSNAEFGEVAARYMGLPSPACVQWQGAGPERLLLFEVKTLHYGPSTYPASAQRCHAVARRAAALPADYANKASRVDRDYCGTQPGTTGPVSARLRTFDPVRGLVFGSWGEASPDVHQLVTALSVAGKRRHYSHIGAESPSDACGGLAWLVKRRLAMTAVRGNARLMLARLEHVGRGAVAAASRRADANSEAAQARRASCAARRGPALLPPGRHFFGGR